jgi:hypothetical protein
VRILHPERQPDRYDEDAERGFVSARRLQQRMRDPVEQQRDQNGGKRQLYFGDPHDDRVDPAARISRNQAQRDPDLAAEQHAAEADRQRNAEPVEDRRPHVAPLVVCAEPKPRIAARDEARRVQRVGEKICGGIERVGRRYPRREQRRQEENDGQDARRDRDLRRQKARQQIAIPDARYERSGRSGLGVGSNADLAHINLERGADGHAAGGPRRRRADRRRD